MYHFIYKTTSQSGKYYIGRHSTKKLNDGYYGSGKWIRSVKDKTILTREILEYCTEETIKDREEYYLNEYIGCENCMNFNTSSVGFSSGELNPAHSPEEKRKRSIRSAGENNPAKRLDVREKISKKLLGKPSPHKGKKMSENGRKNISDGRIGIKYSDEGRKKLSSSRKLEYESGTRNVPSFTGMTHSDEYKLKMKESYLNRPKKVCSHCNTEFSPTIYGRWHGDNCKVKKI
jgi:hypothetical protein